MVSGQHSLVVLANVTQSSVVIGPTSAITAAHSLRLRSKTGRNNVKSEASFFRPGLLSLPW